MTDVQGRIAFITGGANGIGLGIARSFARAGASLVLVDVDAGALSRAKSELQDVTRVETFVLDVRDRQAYAAVADAAEKAVGPVSLLFNNAGVAGAFPSAKLTFDLWDWSIGINLGGVVNGVQTFLPRIIERGQGGHIVNTASGAGLAPNGPNLLYCTAKSAVIGLSESLFGEFGASDIGVSVLCPGPVATGIVARSADHAPKEGLSLTPDQEKWATDRRALATAFLQQGISADQVGDMVLTAVLENRLYIHTDRMLEEPIKRRTRALLDAMPD